MDTHINDIPMLELFQRPAFYVEQGIITQVNQAASAYLLRPGEAITPLLDSGNEEYLLFTEGCLYLTLRLADQKVDATIIAMDDRHLFVLEQDTALAELQALALAARELRNPLTGLLSIAEQLIPAQADTPRLAQYHRRTHQIMRIISNMSDAVYYCQSVPGRQEYVQICGFLEELLSKTAEQLAQADIHLHYSLPATPIYTLADIEKVERAIYNLISNAAKHTVPGGRIHFTLTAKKRLYLSVADSGNGSAVQSNAYSRYLRTPSITDGSEGIGLGMVLVRATAALHNGTVLIDHPDGQGTRVTMTLDLRQEKTPQIRSPLFYPDYAGERDHGLQELSDVLPASVYAEDDSI